MIRTVDDFIDSLKDCPAGALFNPWWQHDPVNDDYSNSAEIRRHQLKFYLQQRLGRCRFFLAGEALGYQGGHFSGIAMTSERLLLGHLSHKGLHPEHVFTGMQPCRTSREEIKKNGFVEPTATIVWSHLLEAGIDPYEFVIWNALPWHPYHPEKGMLSNRTPSDKELAAGHAHLLDLARIMAPRTIVAVGEKASRQLELLGIEHRKARHPANGGAVKFRQNFDEISRC
jgi:uracil-DNA glycosylase